MAKPNYSYEKRQRDLAKKKKKEEKMAKKQSSKAQNSTELDADFAPSTSTLDPRDH